MIREGKTVFMGRPAEHKNTAKTMLFVLFLLSCFQNLKIVSIATEAALKPVHLYALLFLPLLCVRKEWKLNVPVLVYVGYVALVSLANQGTFGLSSLLLNYLFGLLLVVVCMNCGSGLTGDDWIDIVRWCAEILMAAVLVKNIVQFDGILWYFDNPDKGHPAVSTFIGGSVNIESSWLGLFAFFFVGSRWKWIYAGVNLFLAFLYASRCGILIAVLAILWLLLPELPKLWTLLQKRKIRLILLAVVAALAAALYATGVYDAVFKRALVRFIAGPSDPGNAGRIRMWDYAFQTSRQYPLGCGAGNCMKALMQVSGEFYGEANIHNVYLQNLIDHGWLGGAAYLLLVVRFFWKERRKLWSNAFVAALFVYCGTSLLQFRGGDTLAFLLLGMHLATMEGPLQKDTWTLRNPFGTRQNTENRMGN